MESFEQFPIFDNLTGMVPEMDVEVVNGSTLRFTPNNNPERPTLIGEMKQPDPGLFLEFAGIRNAADKDRQKACAKSGRCADEASSETFYNARIVAFAKKHGPLFGFAGLSDTQPVIEESLKDWIDAQRVMEATLLVNVFLNNGEVNYDVIGQYFTVASRVADNHLEWLYQFVPGVIATGLYKQSLKEDFSTWYTTDDESQIGFFWSKDITEHGMSAILVTRYELLLGAKESASEDFKSIPLDAAFSHHEIQIELPSILKIVAEAHCEDMYLGFRNLYSDTTKNEGGFQVLSKSMLAYMWYELALSYSRGAFKRCTNPRCDNIIVENLTTGTAKEYCSDACRAQVNNAKLTAQCRRGRESFYAGNDFLTIYRDAFETEARPDDPECRNKMERLKRWINKDYSRTKKGKIALQKGAGRLPKRNKEKENAR